MNNIDRFYRLPEVIALVGLSRSTIYRLMDLGLFPPSVCLTGAHAVGWRESDLSAWVKSRQSQQ